jgi:RNA polymerase sigma-70 factor (sigma-E family)
MEGEPGDQIVETTVDDPTSLYRRAFASAVRLAVAMVDVPAIAEDLVQDAFADVWLRWDRLDNPEAYLRTCVVNRCRRELRRRMLRRRVVSAPSAAPDDPHADLLDVVRALPPRRRAVVVLRFYEDMSEAQIAATLGMRPGTVKATLHQALAQLREVIER